MKHILILSAIAFLMFPDINNAQKIVADSIWSTAKNLDIPESAYYSHTQKMIFVSNISGKSNEKDGSGFISKVSLNGDIIEKQWISGLDAPKGIVEIDNKLFVSNIDELVEIDVNNSIITNRYKAPSSKFLNDVTADNSGIIYVSDMLDQTIYQLKNGTLTPWIKSDSLNRVNGLFYKDNSIYAGTSNSIMKIDVATGKMEIWATNTGGIDGIEYDGLSGFIFSDWQGHVYHIKQGEAPTLLIDTTKDKINAADIGFNLDDKVFYVPTFMDNRVVAYRLKVTK